MSIVALCAWAARVSWSPDNEDVGDNIRARVVEARDEYDGLRADLAAHKRALAAGPAAPRAAISPTDYAAALYLQAADDVEAAQEAALKGGG
jgi:hypothetical protein